MKLTAAMILRSSITFREVAHRKPHHTIGFVGAVHVDDVRMLEPRAGACFTEKTLALLRSRLVGVQHLERNQTVEKAVAHATGAQRPNGIETGGQTGRQRNR
ncbi:MAG: hypothetical protein HEQ38_09790 [Gemmatimonas sp.]|uniref:hypothetical protein n=1 Tax=Gemmatimonas sp. TaxID=1962908 RepID=UPI0031C8627C|nr:hypothetical protein [Gemmatimonas sp.]